MWAALGAYDLFVDQMLPNWLAVHMPKFHEVISYSSGWLPFWAWIIIGLLIVIGACVEYAWRLERPRPTSAPGTNRNRISLVDLAVLAEHKFEWRFPDEWHDFSTAIRHGVNDGHISLEGRVPPGGMPADLWDHCVFRPMPRDYLETVSIKVPWKSATAANNREITLKPFNVFIPFGEDYRDIHVTDSEEAYRWLAAAAVPFRGLGQRQMEEHAAQFLRDMEWQNENMRTALKAASIAPERGGSRT